MTIIDGAVGIPTKLLVQHPSWTSTTISWPPQLSHVSSLDVQVHGSHLRVNWRQLWDFLKCTSLQNIHSPQSHLQPSQRRQRGQKLLQKWQMRTGTTSCPGGKPTRRPPVSVEMILWYNWWSAAVSNYAETTIEIILTQPPQLKRALFSLRLNKLLWEPKIEQWTGSSSTPWSKTKVSPSESLLGGSEV